MPPTPASEAEQPPTPTPATPVTPQNPNSFAPKPDVQGPPNLIAGLNPTAPDLLAHQLTDSAMPVNGLEGGVDVRAFISPVYDRTRLIGALV